MKFLRRLLIALVVFAALWSALWFGAATWIEGRVDDAIAEAAREGTTIACAGRDVSGYPFALRLRCPRARVEGQGGALALADLSAGLSLADPNTFRAEPTAPGEIVPREGDVVRLDWSDMDLAVEDAFSDDRAFAATFANLAAEGRLGTYSAGAGTLRAVPVGPAPSASVAASVRDDLRVTIAQRAVRVEPNEAPDLPELELPRLEADVTLAGAYEALVRRGESARDYARSGFSGRVERLSVALPDDGLLLVSGPFSVDAEGRQSGEITVAVRNAPAVAAFARQVGGEEAGLVIEALAGLGETREIDGERVQALDVTVANGKIPVGFFSFDLPPLWRVASGS